MSSIYSQHKPDSGNDTYLKLKDGDNFKLRIMSDPVITVYKAEQRPRYAWVIYNHDLGKAQVYNAGISVYSQIAALTEDWGEPTEFDIRVKREGSTIQDTSYLVTPVKTSTEPPKEGITEAEKIDLVQATKGKWLAKYVEDGELPDPISNELDEPAPKKDDVVIEDIGDEPINLDDIPF